MLSGIDHRKKALWSFIFLVVVCLLVLDKAQADGVPTSGSYVTDIQNTWIQDRVGDRISTVNMIMCIMGALRADLMVNKDPYLALVDQSKCKGKSDSSKSTNSNAGASNAANYMTAIVASTQRQAIDPLTMKAWITETQTDGDGTPRKNLIYVYLEATEGKSSNNPNGLFKMYFCGTDPDSNQACSFEGTLKSDTNGLTFYEKEASHDQDAAPGSFNVTQLRLRQQDKDNGIGKIQGVDGSSYSYSFAYNPDFFRRKDTSNNTDTCFIRNQSRAHVSTWRYGTYKSDGSRLELQNPGFPVKYVNGNTSSYGYWGFWGLWLPDNILAQLGTEGTLTRQTSNGEQTLDIVKKVGKLWKYSRSETTLDNLKNTPLQYSLCRPIGNLTANSGNNPCLNYELQWNGTQLISSNKSVCDGPNGCTPTAIEPPIVISASDFRNVGLKSLQTFSSGGDGSITVPDEGDFNGSSSVFYRIRDVVDPNASNRPSNLVCLNNCPKAGVSLTTGISQGEPWKTITAANFNNSGTSTVSSGGNFSPVPLEQALSYVFDGQLSNANNIVDLSTADRDSLGVYQQGLQSGYLIDASDTQTLASIRCNANNTADPAGGFYCPWLVNQAAVSYQWETGINAWNQYFGANGVTIDAPKNLSFTATADNIVSENTNKYIGSSMQLQFNGFGELNGLPGACVNPETNQVVNCNQQARWIPALDIKDGSVVKEGNTNYYVKYLEREMRLTEASGLEAATCNSAVDLSGAASLVLPSSSDVDLNAALKLGAAPVVSSSKPSVIDGVIQ